MRPALRLATSADVNSLAALSIEVWLSTYIKRGVSDAFARYALTAFTPEVFHSQIAAPEFHLIVSDNEEGPDGYGMLGVGHPCPLQDAEIAPFEICKLYVQPRHGRKGIGRALLGALEVAALSKGASSLWLSVEAENSRALSFYTACGFADIGETQFIIEDASYPNRVLAKRLKA